MPSSLIAPIAAMSPAVASSCQASMPSSLIAAMSPAVASSCQVSVHGSLIAPRWLATWEGPIEPASCRGGKGAPSGPADLGTGATCHLTCAVAGCARLQGPAGIKTSVTCHDPSQGRGVARRRGAP
jgi:hypothetical protein